MVLHEFGGIVEDEWKRSAEIREELNLDTYVVMPNHVHAIVIFDPIYEKPRGISRQLRVGAHPAKNAGQAAVRPYTTRHGLSDPSSPASKPALRNASINS